MTDRDVRWLPAACGSWTVHLDANALVKKGIFDLLRATAEALKCDVGVLGEDQIGLDARQMRSCTYCEGEEEATLPIGPSPILRGHIFLDNAAG